MHSCVISTTELLVYVCLRLASKEINFDLAWKNRRPLWCTTTSMASQASPPCSPQTKPRNLQVNMHHLISEPPSFCFHNCVVEQLLSYCVLENPEVISVEPSKMHTTATTRSWDFLGLNYQKPASGLLHGSNYGEDVIIGVVDSG